MADKQFEQKLQEQMEQFKLRPSDAVWQNVDAQLRKDKRRRWFFFLLIASLLIATGTGLYITQKQKPAITAAVETTKEIQPNSPTLNKQPIPAQITSTTKTATVTDQTEQLTSTKDKISNDAAKTLQNKTTAKAPVITYQHQQTGFTGVSKKIKQTPQPPAIIKKNEPSKEPVNSASSAGTVLPPAPTGVNQPDLFTNKPKENSTTVQTPAVDSTSTVTPKQEDTVAVQVVTPTNDTVVKISSSVPKESKKRKWQTGFQLNMGVADIKETLFPGSAYKSLQTETFTQGSSGTAPAFAGVNIKEYTVKSSANIGFGFAVRKQIFKQSWFASGIQYQFNRFSVNTRVRSDTFSVTTNRLVNAFADETKQSFSFHYIQIPTEIQWHIAKTTKGTIMLGSGLLHNFRFAGTSAIPLFITTASKAGMYQPLLYITPAYEWKIKTGTLQTGWYFNYGLLPVYNNSSKNQWWQMGLRMQFYFNKK